MNTYTISILLSFTINSLMEFINTNVSRLVILYAIQGILLDKIRPIRNSITNTADSSYIQPTSFICTCLLSPKQYSVFIMYIPLTLL